MKSFKHFSIKNKIIAIEMIVTILVLSIGFAFAIITYINNLKNDTVDNSVIQAKIMAENSSAALHFERPEHADKLLKTLELVPSVINARLYDKDGMYFAGYNKMGTDLSFNNTDFKSDHWFEDDFLHISEPVLSKGNKIGMMYLRIDTQMSDKIMELTMLTSILYIVLIILVYILTIRLQKIISNPITKLSEFTKKISDKADYTIRIDGANEDEIGDLYNAFNEMLEQIYQRAYERDKAMTKYKESERRYRRLAENAKDMIYRMSIPEGEYEYISPASYKNTGFTPDELYNNPNLFLDQIHPEWKEYYQVQWKRLLAGDLAPYWEFQFIKKDGQSLWLHQRNVLLRDDIGKPIAIESILTDITEIKSAENEIRVLNKELEGRVKKRTEELEVAYNELKEFAYITSHDLKTPLRGISRPVQWIKNDYANCFDEAGNEMLDIIITRVHRMENLINGILRYLRAGSFAEDDEYVDIQKLVENMLSIIVIPDNIRIEIVDELPLVEINRERMEHVFQNLIDNAVKYNDKKNGLIQIGFENNSDSWKFWIKDNGPGIEKKYHKKIFGIFQTLAPKDVTESTGIGLSIVKKIVDNYEGDIWVESEPGKGATFYFTILKNRERMIGYGNN